MAIPVFAMDTNFHHSLGVYSFDARCEMLAELGYDATYLTLWSEAAWADLARLPKVREEYGLDVAAVYVTPDIGESETHEGNRRVVELIETLDGCDTIEISIKSSDTSHEKSSEAGDAAAVTFLGKLLEIADRRGKTLALYPHINFWMERIEDAVRLCRRIDHPRLRMVFTGYHWYAVDGSRLDEHLVSAAPYLALANICGSRRFNNGSGLPATIETLDSGELDTFAVLGSLRRTGFSGPIGIQGYSIGGDVYTNLKRSLTAFRDMERRLEQHPTWADLRPPRK